MTEQELTQLQKAGKVETLATPNDPDNTLSQSIETLESQMRDYIPLLERLRQTEAGESTLTVWVPAGVGYSLVHSTEGNVATMRLDNGAGREWVVPVKVPAGATGLASAKLFYVRLATGNIYLRFHTFVNSGVTEGASQTSDTSDTHTTYASSGSDSNLGIITVPGSAFDDLVFTEDDLLTLYINRNASHANDTYEAHLHLAWIKFEFE